MLTWVHGICTHKLHSQALLVFLQYLEYKIGMEYGIIEFVTVEWNVVLTMLSSELWEEIDTYKGRSHNSCFLYRKDTRSLEGETILLLSLIWREDILIAFSEAIELGIPGTLVVLSSSIMQAVYIAIAFNNLQHNKFLEDCP